MTLANVLDYFNEARWWHREKTCGRMGSPPSISDEAADVTAVFDCAFDDSLTVFVPVRRTPAGRPIEYRIANLAPPVGAQIICESEETKFGPVDVHPEQPLIKTDGGDTTLTPPEPGTDHARVRIIGGTWRGGCVWRHVRHGALVDCVFEGMRFKTPSGSGSVGYGFRLSSAVNCVFRDLQFVGASTTDRNVTYGIYFDGTGRGDTNTNRIVGCRFTHLGASGIYVADSPEVKGRNTISECWFEDVGEHGIFVGGNTRALHIRDCYLAHCGADSTTNGEWADIHLESGEGTIDGVVIANSMFGTPSTAQTRRVYANERASFVARHNVVKLNDTRRVFVHIDSDRKSYLLEHNYLEGGRGTPTSAYRDQLYSLERGRTAPVSWDTYVESAFVTGDEYPFELTAGRSVNEFQTLVVPPSHRANVSSGNTYLLQGADLETLEAGFPGQIVRFVASTSINVLLGGAGNIHLSGGTSFAMGPGSTLTLICADATGSGDEWWELSRSVQ